MLRRVAALALGLALLAGATVACTRGPVGAEAASPGATCRGTRCAVFRAAVPDLQLTGALDPTVEAGPLAMGLYSQLLLGGLTTFRHVRGWAGLVPVLDLAHLHLAPAAR